MEAYSITGTVEGRYGITTWIYGYMDKKLQYGYNKVFRELLDTSCSSLHSQKTHSQLKGLHWRESTIITLNPSV